MLGLVPELGTSDLRLWVAAGSAALLAAFLVLAVAVPRTGKSAVLRCLLVIVAAAAGVAGTWATAVIGDQGAERQQLEYRAQALSARALAPGSPLSCLDALGADSLAAACEHDIFASPMSVASAISYTAARAALLADIEAYAARSHGNVDDLLLPLRRSLEADTFGLLAHVLATQDDCTAQSCRAFALLRDASRVRANLSDATLPHYLEHYLPVWAKAVDATVAAEVKQMQPPGATQHVVNIDFPTAASIPAISIMNPEPKGPVLPGAAAAAASNPNPPSSSSRHAHRPAANPRAPVSAPADSANAVEPIWPEPVPPPPQTAAAPAGSAPVQPSPGPAPPQASASPAMHAQ
jgi:hypothetical protein